MELTASRVGAGVGALVLLVFGIVETGAVSLHRSNTSTNSQASTRNAVVKGKSGCPVLFRSEIEERTWESSLWLGLYQRHVGTGTALATWTSPEPCSIDGRSNITTEITITCTGLRGFRACRSELDGALQTELDKVRQEYGGS